MIEPLRTIFEVACSVEHAFLTWTTKIDTWWPNDHTVSGVPASVVLETRTGGRIFERAPTGDEYEWGEVIIWDPPTRLVYLWHLRRDRTDATEVEINFAATEDGRTRVEIEHRGWERLGAGGQEWRDRNRIGWDTLLPHFVAAAERSAQWQPEAVRRTTPGS